MLRVFVRLLAYSILVAAVVVPLWLDSAEPVDFVTAHKVGEHTWTEFIHIVLAASISLVFYWSSRIDEEARVLCQALSIFFIAAVFREWEDYFHFFNENLKTVCDIVVPILLLYICWLVFRDRKAFAAGIALMFQTIASGYFVIGLVILFVFSRIYGTGNLWQALLEDYYTRTVKNASQETLETLGYVLVLAAAIEFGRALRGKQLN